MRDETYSVTRRRGKRATLTIDNDVTVNPQTGVKTRSVTTLSVRWCVRQPTRYSRLIYSKAVQRDVGDVTFILWRPDVPSIVKLNPTDYITFDGKRYDALTCDIEDNSLLITARLHNA